jgi:tetratricopeptide (TPR) repeat protein
VNYKETKTYQEYIIKANSLLAEKEYQQLEQLMDEALKKYEDSEFYYLRSIALTKQIDIDGICETSLQVDGICETSLQALSDIEKAIDLERKESYLLRKVELIQDIIEEYDNVSSLHVFIDCKPFYIDRDTNKLIRNFGVDSLHTDMNDQCEIAELYLSALETMNELIEKDPDPEYYDIRLDLIIYYYDSVKVVFEMIAPENGENLFKRIDEYLEIEYHRAKKLIEVNPTEDLLIKKSKLDKLMNRYDEAIDCLDAAFQLSDNFELLQEKADLLLLTNKKNQALEVVNQIERIYLKDIEKHNRLNEYLISKYDQFNDIEKCVELLSMHNDLSSYYTPWICRYLLKAFKSTKHEIVSQHFSSDKYDSNIIVWFKIWSLYYTGETLKAEDLMSSFSFKDLYLDIQGSYHFKDIMHLFTFSYPCGIEANTFEPVKEIISAIPFERFDLISFVDAIVFLLHPHIDSAQAEDILNKVLQKAYTCDYHCQKMKADETRIVEPDWDRDSDIMISVLNIIRNKNISFKYSLDNDVLEIGLEPVLTEMINRIYMIKNQKATEIAVISERNRVMSNLSHSIKNILRAVLDPLHNLKNEIPAKSRLIDNAIQGANLIREMVNSINLSFKTSIDEIYWDIIHAGQNSTTIEKMIVSSLVYSIGNMFDFRYFPVYAENFYPRTISKSDYESIQRRWQSTAGSMDIGQVIAFCKDHLFDISVDLSDTIDYHIGNEKSSALKLMILFQEIIFNAVKYVSFRQKEERFIKICLASQDEKLKLTVANSYDANVMAKTTGVGKVVIENFSRVLGCEPKISADDNIYSISMTFDNYWRKNAKSALH